MHSVFWSRQVAGISMSLVLAVLAVPPAAGSPDIVGICNPFGPQDSPTGLATPSHGRPLAAPDAVNPNERSAPAILPALGLHRSTATGSELWEESKAIGWLGSTMIVDPVRDRLVLYGGGNDLGWTGATWVKPLEGTAGWTLLDVRGPGPGSKINGTAFYDPVRERMIVFGGLYTNGVWALSLSGTPVWTMLATAGSGPADRQGARAIYDPVGDRMITFGGYSPPFQNDIWAFGLGDGSGWTLLSPAGTPPTARSDGAAIYDPVRRRMILFSGRGSNSPQPPTVPDIWALSLGDTLAWTELHASGETPSGLYSTAAAFDSIHDRMVVYGGFEWGVGERGDAWALQFGDSLSWTHVEPSGPRPSARTGTCLICDDARDRYVMFGGGGTDTWSLSLAPSPVWRTLEPGSREPSSLGYLASAVYDSARHRALMFGGHGQYLAQYDWRSYENDKLWSLTFETRSRWTSVDRDSAPPGLYGRSTIIDTQADRLIAFGGFSGAKWIFGGLWQLPLNGTHPWSQVEIDGTPPPARYLHTAIYDPTYARMVVFGGRAFARAFNDTWVLSLVGKPRWTQLDSLAPQPRYGQAAVYDPIGNRMIMFGGATDASCFGDTWQLLLTEVPVWSSPVTGPGPPARAFASMVYDSHRQRVVLYGGRGQNGRALNDVWFLPLANGAKWVRGDTTNSVPPARWGAAAVFDPDRDRVVISQGTFNPCTLATGATYSDCWTMSSVDPAPAAPAVMDVQAQPWNVSMSWQGTLGPTLTGAVQRKSNTSEWIELSVVTPDAGGRVRLEDRTALPGSRYGYRLVWSVGAVAGSTPEVWVDVPRLRFALVGATPNPSQKGLKVAFSLPDAEAARLDVFDVSGRRLLRQDVGGFGPGDHVLDLGATRAFPPGIYMVRLERGGESQVARVSVLR